MPKITFMGAGSTVFAKNIIGDCMCSEALRGAHFALYDIDGARLRESKMMLENLNRNINQGRAKITAHLGVRSRKAAMLDPHTCAELSIDEIRHLCDDLIEAHGSWLPEYT